MHRILCIPRKLLETCRLRVRFCPAGIGRRLQRGGKQQKRRLAKSLTGHDCRDRHNSIGADYAESVHNSGTISRPMAEPETTAPAKSENDSLVETEPSKIPNRLFFRIGDVAELAGVETHVLRFWESEFPRFSPKKTSTGQRQYRRKDVEAVLEIKRLLYDEGYTIAGARKVLRQKAKSKRKVPAVNTQPALLFPEPQAANPKILAVIKQELRKILTLLERR